MLYCLVIAVLVAAIVKIKSKDKYQDHEEEAQNLSEESMAKN
jgi:hypothetical protein